MQKSFASVALLLIAFLFSVTQIAAAPAETQDDNAKVKQAGFPVYDMYRSLYNDYYSRWVARTMAIGREVETAQFPPFPPFPPPPTFPPFPPFPPRVNALAERDVEADQFPPFPPFPPPPTFPPFPPFPPRINAYERDVQAEQFPPFPPFPPPPTFPPFPPFPPRS